MPDICETMPGSWTITRNKVQFERGICPEKSQLDQIQNGRLKGFCLKNVQLD